MELEKRLEQKAEFGEMMGGRCEKNVGSAREDRNYMIEL